MSSKEVFVCNVDEAGFIKKEKVARQKKGFSIKLAEKDYNTKYDVYFEYKNDKITLCTLIVSRDDYGSSFLTFKGKAVCNLLEDTYNKEAGEQIAMGRAIDKFQKSYVGIISQLRQQQNAIAERTDKSIKYLRTRLEKLQVDNRKV